MKVRARVDKKLEFKRLVMADMRKLTHITMMTLEQVRQETFSMCCTRVNTSKFSVKRLNTWEELMSMGVAQSNI